MYPNISIPRIGRLIFAIVATGLASLALAGESQAPIDASPTAEEISKALGGLAAKVERSTRIRGPILGDVGQFVVRLAADKRELGIYVRAYRFPIDQTPAFWINLLEDPGQAVVFVREKQIVINELPSNWNIGDYLNKRESGPEAVSFISINPARRLRRLASDGSVVAESDFEPFRAILARTRFWIDKSGKEVRAFATMAYYVRDEQEAQRLLDALERLRE
jgi:hypothetical protein